MSTVADDPLTNLLNLPFDSFESMSEVHLYVRRLRDTIRKQYFELSYYRDINQYLRKYSQHQLSNVELFYEYRKLDSIEMIDRLWAVTITFDPNRFHNIDLTSEEEQQLYIKFHLMKAIRRFNIPFLYGSFEKHKNGRTHFHGVVSIYDNTELEKYLLRKFTNNPRNKHCILWKAIDNLPKWLEYINKESLDFISYKNQKKCIEKLIINCL